MWSRKFISQALQHQGASCALSPSRFSQKNECPSVQEITMITPVPDNLTEEDSGNEDSRSSSINNLNGRLLQAAVELNIHQPGPSSFIPASFYGCKRGCLCSHGY